MADDDLLNGWKAIAGYLKISEKNAHRWERSDNLPILRPHGRGKGPVFATKSALDAWLQGSLRHVALENNRLIGIARSGRIAWTYDFPAPLRQFSSEEAEWRIQRVSLPGENAAGVLFTAQFAEPSQVATMFCFKPQGKLYWTLEADPQLLDRNDRRFERAWNFKNVVIVPSERPTIWAALANEAGWAGCVLSVDILGRPTLQFANAGYVERICPLPTPDGDALVICGENNAFDQAFVALLNLNDPPSSSPPGGRPRYRYANSLSGVPSKYILFPRTELIVARQKPYGHAQRIRHYDNHIVVEVETAGNGSCFLYHFSPKLEPKYVFPSGSHEFGHHDLELAGRIDHDWSHCLEMEEPLKLGVWTPATGWHDESIPWRDNPWKEK